MLAASSLNAQSVEKWHLFEQAFESSRNYQNPLYEVNSFKVLFQSPGGREITRNGFWDGGLSWKVRFCPDEVGTWTFRSACSDTSNSGLHGFAGSFECLPNTSQLEIYRRGVITRPRGGYYLSYGDGTPFFYTACTAWNGALLSTEEEWDTYLKNRVDNSYNTIQFVTTQWRGCAANSQGEVAFTGSGKIELNAGFFQHMDKKIQRINDYGLVAAPVLLWALPFADGTELSPGYYLPQREAILLAKYMVARFGGYHVIWILGGDGKYYGELEDRWKAIGRGVFAEEHPGLVTLHPHGRSWIGDIYADEEWMDIVGYQSSHSNAKGTVNWINTGPPAQRWDKIPARPVINLEPNYEQIRFLITAEDVRNASYWSLFATPPAGITYGANGIWPWLRKGDRILNHRDAPGTSPWYESIHFPGSKQIGYLNRFFRKLEWWKLIPANHLLVNQPGKRQYNHFVSVLATPERDVILVYIPHREEVALFNPAGYEYSAQWFNPETNEYSGGTVLFESGRIKFTSPREGDMVLVLKKE